MSQRDSETVPFLSHFRAADCRPYNSIKYIFLQHKQLTFYYEYYIILHIILFWEDNKMTNTSISLGKARLSVKTQTLAALAAIVAAVALPQIFHVMGAASGLGTALGEVFLPMHLPIILVGLLAGAYAGAAAGLVSPLISFALTGMPSAVMLPFMMIELCIYGLIAGLLRNVKMNTLLKVLISQLAGRFVRAAVIIFAVYVLKNTPINPAMIFTSVYKGIFGLALQWALIPLIIYRVENGNEN